jgi:hypothetical protein
MDLKSASLNNNLEKKVYVGQPAGFVVKREKKGLQIEERYLWA